MTGPPRLPLAGLVAVLPLPASGTKAQLLGLGGGTAERACGDVAHDERMFVAELWTVTYSENHKEKWLVFAATVLALGPLRGNRSRT